MSAASKRKGSRFEREAARALGGKRTPLSGGAGGNDITLPSGSLWEDWAIECKSRKNLPGLVTNALDQALYASTAYGGRKRPMALLKGDGTRIVCCVFLDDLRAFCEALAEGGQTARVKALLRDIARNAEEARRLV